MKLLVLLFSILITGMIALSPAEKNISGTWVMQTGAGACSPAVIRISMEEGSWQGKLDMPDQQEYDRPIYSIRVKGDSVFIAVSKGGNYIKAVLLNEHELAGELFTDDNRDAVRFTRL